MSDLEAQAAREHHRLALKANSEAAHHRARRNEMVRRLRDDDPRRWTHAALAKLLGVSEELIAVILRGGAP